VWLDSKDGAPRLHLSASQASTYSVKRWRATPFNGNLPQPVATVVGNLRVCILAQIIACLCFAPRVYAISLDWVTVPGGDSRDLVDYTYRFGTYEVTNAQYAEFLNSVASRSDPNQLYKRTPTAEGYCCLDQGIRRSGLEGDYSYAPIAGRESMPVILVSWYDALRFANWVHNGTPTGGQDAATTEDGAYTLTPQSIADHSIARNPHAQVFLPTWLEWWKAGYYDPATDLFFQNPNGSDAGYGCAWPFYSDNCGGVVGDLTEVGGFGSSPLGTFDQGGNVHEWIETSFVHPTTGAPFARAQGGSWRNTPFGPTTFVSRSPGSFQDAIGIRLAMIPEPDTVAMFGCGLLALAAIRRSRCRSSGFWGS
jgi:hypothetical protein